MKKYFLLTLLCLNLHNLFSQEIKDLSLFDYYTDDMSISVGTGYNNKAFVFNGFSLLNFYFNFHGLSIGTNLNYYPNKSENKIAYGKTAIINTDFMELTFSIGYEFYWLNIGGIFQYGFGSNFKSAIYLQANKNILYNTVYSDVNATNFPYVKYDFFLGSEQLFRFNINNNYAIILKYNMDILLPTHNIGYITLIGLFNQRAELLFNYVF